MEFGSSQRNFSLEKAQRTNSTQQSNRPLLRKKTVKKMQNILEANSDDDDDDIMLMQNKGLREKATKEEDGFLCQQKEDLEEQRQDNLLKELGLYEEGMSKEQKQEFLLVIEESKESAKNEETMRKKSDEWTSDMLVINGKTKDAKEFLASSTSRSDSPSQERKKTKLVTVGDSDEDTRLTPSQDLFPSLPSDPEQQLLSQEKMQDLEEDSYGSFPAGQQASENPMLKQLDSSARPPSRWLLTRLNRKRNSQDRRTSAMDTVMAVWTSQIASAVVTSLVRNTKSKVHLSDEVPYFCPVSMIPSMYTKAILCNIDNYHVRLQKVQRRTPDHIPWGDPITLGKSRLVGQHRSRDVPSTSAEEPPNDQSDALPDLEVWPVGHLEIRPVSEEKPVQISETSKKDDCLEDVFTILSRRSGSVENDESSKKSPRPENEVSDTNDDNEHYAIKNTSFHQPKLSLTLESEFEIVPLSLDDDAPEGVITNTGGALSSTTDGIIPEIKPKQLRKRGRNNDLHVAANTVCTEKRPKRQVKDKHSVRVKR